MNPNLFPLNGLVSHRLEIDLGSLLQKENRTTVRFGRVDRGLFTYRRGKVFFFLMPCRQKQANIIFKIPLKALDNSIY